MSGLRAYGSILTAFHFLIYNLVDHIISDHVFIFLKYSCTSGCGETTVRLFKINRLIGSTHSDSNITCTEEEEEEEQKKKKDKTDRKTDRFTSKIQNTRSVIA